MKTILFWICLTALGSASDKPQYKFDPEGACRSYLTLKFDQVTTDWIMGYPLLPETLCIAPRVNVRGGKPKLMSGTGTTYRWVDADGQVACLFRWKDGNTESYYLYDKREGRDTVDPKPIEQIVKEDTSKAKTAGAKEKK